MPGHSRNGKRRFRSNRERVQALFSLFRREDRVLIPVWADPDALASAFAVKRLLAQRVSQVVIAHVNEIRRVNNQLMISLLRIPVVKFSQISLEDFSRFVLVDAQPPHHEVFQKISFDVVIDHHPETQGWEASLVDIRPEYGASSTILAEYLKAVGISPSVALATALVYGIKTDTDNFEKHCTLQDVIAFHFLFKRLNRHLLHKIEASDIRRSELKYIKLALENMKFRKQRLFTHIGRVPNPDILVVIADFLNHVQEAGWVFVSGEYRQKLVVIIRCDGYRKDAGRLAARAFGSLGLAGGHREKARAEIPLATLGVEGNGNLNTLFLIQLLRKHFRDMQAGRRAQGAAL
ncbi:phosphoethanolamine methyltransferase [Thermosulfurimonas marina]|uniref:Phosphoethanolamine methyltransferase n=1 Tax=Thermosulfurimonas marina TaxID=2047767 RepID=A0A6H1WSM2_9BACT|nr:DHH family phosphoesterase [Thermosulfurimonas marina]QJA06126.1 phosphoethanolamine methyltransferase [Thermosulfurimonas marina]